MNHFHHSEGSEVLGEFFTLEPWTMGNGFRSGTPGDTLVPSEPWPEPSQGGCSESGAFSTGIWKGERHKCENAREIHGGGFVMPRLVEKEPQEFHSQVAPKN